MIALLKGKIELKENRFVIVDVKGVGYKVYCPAPILEKLILKQEVKLFIHLYHREIF